MLELIELIRAIMKRILAVRLYRIVLVLASLTMALLLVGQWIAPALNPPLRDQVIATYPSARLAVQEAREAGSTLVAVPLNPFLNAFIATRNIDYEDRISKITIRWDNVFIAIGGLLISLLALREVISPVSAGLRSIFAFERSPVRPQPRSVQLEDHQSWTIEGEQQKEKLLSIDQEQQVSLEKSADEALGADIKLAITLAAALYSRSTLLLAGGIVMSFIGIAVFWASLPEIAADKKFDLTSYLPQTIRPLGMLLFVEAIAWFLLRQYRALVEDYKLFHRMYLRRVNFLAALRITSKPNVAPSELSVAAALLVDDLTSRLRPGETTETLEATKQIDSNPLVDLLTIIINRAADVASVGAQKKNDSTPAS